ncbi:MAG: endonuclease/exonuclease/phosphatase family protein [Candidatus Nomurabacteria bacterium]|nr:MAG: endonuclease/exonuclease/phosphatase family protein [Candidatus Nomurabacteria bacterium]
MNSVYHLVVNYHGKIVGVKLKVVCLNLMHGGELFENVIDFLNKQEADIVLTQETYSCEDPTVERQYRTMQTMPQLLGYDYVHLAPTYRDFDRTNGRAQRGNGVFSKYPLTPKETVFFDGEYSEDYRDVPGQFQNCPRNLEHVVLHTPAGDVDLFNIQGVWDMDGDNYSEKRQHMAQTVIREIEGLKRVILGGDTNAKPYNQAIIEIDQHLKSVFGKDELITTFNMRRKDNPGYASAVVDMIFVSPSIQVVEKSCPDVDVSDHLPLVATLEI